MLDAASFVNRNQDVRVTNELNSPRYLQALCGHVSIGPPSSAALGSRSAAPQTTLAPSRPLPVLEPQTTLKAESRLSLQGKGVLETIEPLFTSPQMFEKDHALEDPQTTERGETVVFPLTMATLPFEEL